MTPFDSMVKCPHCPHGAGFHDGSGCHGSRCECVATKEMVLNDSIELMWKEDRDRYKSGALSTK